MRWSRPRHDGRAAAEAADGERLILVARDLAPTEMLRLKERAEVDVPAP